MNPMGFNIKVNLLITISIFEFNSLSTFAPRQRFALTFIIYNCRWKDHGPGTVESEFSVGRNMVVTLLLVECDSNHKFGLCGSTFLLDHQYVF